MGLLAKLESRANQSVGGRGTGKMKATDLERYNVILARANIHLRKSPLQIQLRLDMRRIAPNLDGEEGARTTTTIREHRDTLVEQLVRRNACQEGGKTSVEGAGVHVTAAVGDEKRWGDHLLVHGCGGGGEGLLDRLVRQGCRGILAQNVGGKISVDRSSRVGYEVVVGLRMKRLRNQTNTREGERRTRRP